MFGNPLWTQLHMKIVRYIAPYDAATRPYSLDKATVWIHDAEAKHQQILVAFYHSEYTPTKLPSVAHLQEGRAEVHQAVPARQAVPVLGRVQPRQRRPLLLEPVGRSRGQVLPGAHPRVQGCTVLGLDVLDQSNIAPTLRYISEFKREIVSLRTVMPKIWGLHNYSDINRLESCARANS